MQAGIRPGLASGPLLLADISGYTGFLAAVADAHRDDPVADGSVPDAYPLMSSLLDGIIAAVVPPFLLAKLEGDAVFAYAISTEGLPRGEGVLACLDACHRAFRERLMGAQAVVTCVCHACMRLGGLDLKFVLHAGPFVIQPMGGGWELVGSEVVMAHRLLKNHAAEVAGSGAYALITDAAATLLDVPDGDSVPLVERYEHLPPVSARVVAIR